MTAFNALDQTTWAWTREDSEVAQAEGWDVFEVHGCSDDGKNMIQRIDDPRSLVPGSLRSMDEPTFDSDEAAIVYVSGKARLGSTLHAKACAVHGTLWRK